MLLILRNRYMKPTRLNGFYFHLATIPISTTTRVST
jgi:hypothetical protein